MTPNEYQKLAARTQICKDPLDAGRHGALGLASEWAEYQMALDEFEALLGRGDLDPALAEHVKKEKGDLWWMLAEIATANKIELDNLVYYRDFYPYMTILTTIGEISGIYQKTYQGHEICRQDLHLYLRHFAHELYDDETEEIWQMNINKLAARYPNGFDPERSLHRAEGDI